MQIPAKTMLFIHDPVFLEKLMKLVPSHLDWNTDAEFFGRLGCGYFSLMDMKSDKFYDQIRSMFVSTMNLN